MSAQPEKEIGKTVTFRPNESVKAELKAFMGIHRLDGNVTEAIHGIFAEYEILKEQQRAGLIVEQKKEDAEKQALESFQELAVECVFRLVVDREAVCQRHEAEIKRLGLEKPRHLFAEFCVLCHKREEEVKVEVEEAHQLGKVQKSSSLAVYDKRIEYENAKERRLDKQIAYKVASKRKPSWQDDGGRNYRGNKISNL